MLHGLLAVSVRWRELLWVCEEDALQVRTAAHAKVEAGDDDEDVAVQLFAAFDVQEEEGLALRLEVRCELLRGIHVVSRRHELGAVHGHNVPQPILQRHVDHIGVP